MPGEFDASHRKLLRIAVWLLFVAGAVYLFLFRGDLLRAEFQRTFSYSLFAAGAVYLLAGCLRGLTLIPSTYLVFAGIAFFPPRTLYLLTITGILISSASVYLFSESFHLEEYFARTDQHRVMKVRSILEKHGLPVIIGWSFFPFVPTDLICYVCGVLKINFWKCLFGVFIGEGAICAIYIFSSDHLLRVLHLRP